MQSACQPNQNRTTAAQFFKVNSDPQSAMRCASPCLAPQLRCARRPPAAMTRRTQARVDSGLRQSIIDSSSVAVPPGASGAISQKKSEPRHAATVRAYGNEAAE
jgi:hypothetical protein